MTESQYQNAVFKWSRQPAVRQKWPELKLLFHIKNETKEGVRQVAIDRYLGVKKGVPDLFLPVVRGAYHGLFIEMKTEKGRTSPEQEWWGEQLSMGGYLFRVCHGWKAAVQTLEQYLTESG